MAVRPRTTVSLFSGIGALDLAIGRVFPDARCLLFVEREIPAVATLAARMEAGDLDAAPVWGDIRTVPTDALRGRVDLVAGGFPCQDISLAGKGAGIEGERSGLFFDLMRLVRDVRPRYVFLENVAAITVRGLDAVLGTLAESGFDAEWACLKASDVGAPHGRDRWWCLAWDREQLADHDDEGRGSISANINARACCCNAGRNADGCHQGILGEVADAPRGGGAVQPVVNDGGRSLGGASAGADGRTVDGRAAARVPRRAGVDTAGQTDLGVGAPVADAECCGHDGRPSDAGRQPQRRVAAARAGEALGHAERQRGLVSPARRLAGEQDAGADGAAVGWPGFPPGPDDRDGWRDYLNRYPDLAPATERAVRGSADGTSARVDRLRGLGNAVVPQQAEAALRALWFRAFDEWP